MEQELNGMRELNMQEMTEVDGGWVAAAWAVTWRLGCLAAGAYVMWKADQD